MKDLKNRVLVLILGGPFMFAVVYFGEWYFTVVIAFIALMGARELIRIGKQFSIESSPVPAMLFTAILPVIAYLYDLKGLLFIYTIMVLVLAFIALLKEPKKGFPNLMLNSFTVFYLGILFGFIVLLRNVQIFATNQDAALFFIYIMAGFWIADSAAYLIGRRFGKRPLAKLLSPNKTLEGTAAELIAAVLWAVFAAFIPEGLLSIVDRVIIGVLIAAAAVIGDLVESMMKRAVGVKDSGGFFPGHGGMLDRFDSMLFVMPTVYMYLVVSGILEL